MATEETFKVRRDEASGLLIGDSELSSCFDDNYATRRDETGRDKTWHRETSGLLIGDSELSSCFDDNYPAWFDRA